MNNPIEPQPPSDPAKPPSSAGPTPSTARGPLFPQGPPDIPDHELLRCIGRGAYGEVWLARNVMGTYRAVKVVYRRTFEHDRPYEREFTGIRRFEPVSRKHHSQVDILHVGRDNERGYFYYVMELADDAAETGEKVGKRESDKSPPAPLPTFPPATAPSQAVSAAQTPPSAETPLSPLTATPTPTVRDPEAYIPHTLKWELHQRGRLPFDECLQIALGLTTALEHLHSHGLVHRDIKPSNIIFVDGVAKLADIGLVAVVEASMSFVGTPGYFPPEGTGTPSADLYALGKVLYEVGLGQDRQEFPKLPPGFATWEEHDQLLEFNAVLVKACQTDPARRYASAADMHAELLLIQSGKSIKRMRWLEQRQSLFTKVIAVGALLTALRPVALHLAREQAKREATLRTRAEASELVTRHNLARELLHRGQALCEKGDVARGLHWMVRSLKETPASSHALKRAIEENLVAWTTQRVQPRAVLLHEAAAWTAAFSPDGRLLATGCVGGVLAVWSVESGLLLFAKKAHSEMLCHVAFSPHGDRVLSTSSDGVRMWSADLGAPIGSPMKHKDVVWCAVFSPDGRLVLSGSTDGTARLWDAATGEPVTPPMNHGAQIWQVAFSPDGKLAVSVSWSKEGTARLWSVPGGEPVLSALPHPPGITGVAFSPDGRMLATGGGDGSVRLWSVKTGEPIGPVLRHHREVWSVEFSADSRRLLTGSADHTARLWSVETGEPIGEAMQHESAAWKATFSPDGELILTGSHDRTAQLWSAKTGERVGFPICAGHDIRLGAFFSPDGATVLTTGRAVKLWSTEECRRGSVHLNHPWTRAARFTPDGHHILTGSSSAGPLKLWSEEVGWSPKWSSPGEGWVTSVAVSPDGRFIVAGERDDNARLWDAATGLPLGITFPHQADITSVTFSRDGRLIATGSEDHTARIWQGQTGQAVGAAFEHSDEVMDVVFSPDASVLVAACGDSAAHLWSVQTGKEILKPLRHRASVTSVDISPDGNLIATGSSDGTARLWYAWSGEATGIVCEHESDVTDVTFSPNGHWLLTTSADGAGRLWSVDAGEQIGASFSSGRFVAEGAFSPDGTRVVLASEAGIIVAQVPRPLTHELQDAGLWIDVLTWMQMDENGIVSWLDNENWRAKREQLEKLGGPPVR